VIGDAPHLLIFDEAPYLIQQDANFPAALQQAWDDWIQDSAVTLVLCGSHLRMMDQLAHHGSPLYGRITLPLLLEPLGFAQLRHFFPRWSAEERVAAYAMVGGVPEYYEWLEPARSLIDNLRDRVLRKPSPFLSEARYLIHDQLEQPAAHISVIRALGQGHHAFDALRLHSEGAPNKLSVYLERLRQLHLVERSVSALVRPQRVRDAKDSRWLLTDPYLRFYFRFLEPALQTDVYDPEIASALIWSQLRGFVGATAFEDLCRTWVRQAGAKQLGFTPTVVGRHHGKGVEADVVALNWDARRIMIGECKWDQDRVDATQARKLLEVTAPRVMAVLAAREGEVSAWTMQPAFFARAGFTAEATRVLDKAGALRVDLKQLDRALK
jgi:hypothetical protein